MTSLFQILSAILNILSFMIIFDVILSLLIQFGVIDKRNQIVSQLWFSIRNIMEPIYSRVRSFLPNTVGFDLAPAALLFIIFAVRVIISNNFY
ncbi:MAG: YggT family protein [Paracoccaceae bacterium]